MLSKNLKKMREFKGVTQAELADFLGITQQAVARWERAKSEPDSDNLRQLSKYFNVSIDYLLDNEKDTSPAFNDAEVTLIYNYRNLNGTGRNLLFGLMESLSVSHSKKNNATSNIHVVKNNQNGNNLYNSNGDNNLIINT